ncbi:MAG: SDR family oxidoreductase [Solirubrobacteraceae bacterium]|jgi:3-oxoacyl-[acyl-carrier protein] reductase
MPIRTASPQRDERGVLAERGALITGASQGLGLAIARAFVLAGAEVMICARDSALLELAQAELVALARNEQAVTSFVADVSDREDVGKLVEAADARLANLSVLVNNAGVQGPVGHLWEVDLDEWVRALEINLIGSALLARAMIPRFERAGGGKLIQISGGGATSPMEGLSAYAASKAAVVRLAETLSLELVSRRVDVNALAPGAMNTRMLDEVLAGGAERVGEAYYGRALEQKRNGGASPERAADLAVWLASARSDGITGKLLSAVWDPWETLDEHRSDLRSDVYTLRRIVPADRGLDWGEPA